MAKRLCCAILLAASGARACWAQDLTLEGARVFTGTSAEWSPTLVVRGGRIAAKDAPATTPVRRVPGFVVPGLHDAHAHLSGLGAALDNVDLVGTKSFAEVIERVRARAVKPPRASGSWGVAGIRTIGTRRPFRPTRSSPPRRPIIQCG